MPTSPTPCWRRMSTRRVASPLMTRTFGKRSRRYSNSGPIELDHHQRFGRQAGIHQALRDRAGAGAELDDHLARPPDDLLADRARQRPRRRDDRAHRLGRAQPLAEEELGFLGLADVDLSSCAILDERPTRNSSDGSSPAELVRRSAPAAALLEVAVRRDATWPRSRMSQSSVDSPSHSGSSAVGDHSGARRDLAIAPQRGAQRQCSAIQGTGRRPLRGSGQTPRAASGGLGWPWNTMILAPAGAGGLGAGAAGAPGRQSCLKLRHQAAGQKVSSGTARDRKVWELG